MKKLITIVTGIVMISLIIFSASIAAATISLFRIQMYETIAGWSAITLGAGLIIMTILCYFDSNLFKAQIKHIKNKIKKH